MESQPEPSRISHGILLRIAVATDVGRVRLNNEDAARFTWGRDGSLHVVVADGMGGHDAGEVASHLAVDALTAALGESPVGDPRDRLHRAMLHTNQVIIDEARVRNTRGMGTTAVAAVLRGAEVYLGTIGDSRLYWFRRGQLLWRTLDHTRVQSLVELGEVTAQEARSHPEAGMLTRALGHAKMIDGRRLAPEIPNEPLVLEPGDALVLSTDGLHDLLEDDEIGLVVAGRGPDEAAQELVRQALERGGHDNVTVAVIVAGPAAAPFDPSFVPPPPRLLSPFVPVEEQALATVDIPPAVPMPLAGSERDTERLFHGLELERSPAPAQSSVAELSERLEGSADVDPENVPTVEQRRLPVVTVMEFPTEEISREVQRYSGARGLAGVESSPRSYGSGSAAVAPASDTERRVSPSWDPRWQPPVDNQVPVAMVHGEPEPVTEPWTETRRARRRDLGWIVILVAVLGFALAALLLAAMFGGLAWLWANA